MVKLADKKSVAFSFEFNKSYRIRVLIAALITIPLILGALNRLILGLLVRSWGFKRA